jgi:hypothetical protein
VIDLRIDLSVTFVLASHASYDPMYHQTRRWLILDLAPSSRTSPSVRKQVPEDPYLAGLVTNFQMLLDHPEHSLAVSRVLASFDLQSLEYEATRVMKKGCIGSYPIAQGGFNTVRLALFFSVL